VGRRLVGTWLRRADAGDAGQIAEIHIRTWQAAYRGHPREEYLDTLDRRFPRRFAFWRTETSHPRTPEHEVWVADDQGQPGGFVGIGAGSNAAGEVYAICVNPACWDRSIGRRLLALATERLACIGYATAMLWVLESNVRARRFYEAAGWIADGEKKTERNAAGIEPREVRYRPVWRQVPGRMLKVASRRPHWHRAGNAGFVSPAGSWGCPTSSPKSKGRGQQHGCMSVNRGRA
jgi:ribosomal protein S18 acetylase RimI-like enzyme